MPAEEPRTPYAAAIPRLLTLLDGAAHSPSLRLRQQVPRAIANLCFGHASNRALCAAGAVPLVALLDDADDAAARNACGACSNLLSQPDEAARALLAAGVLAGLGRALRRAPCAALAVRGLTNACEVDETAQQCGDQLEDLVGLCVAGEGDDDALASEAGDLLLTLCRQNDNATKLASSAALVTQLGKRLDLAAAVALLEALCDVGGLRVGLAAAMWQQLETQVAGPHAAVAAQLLALLSVDVPARVLAALPLWVPLLGPGHAEALRVAALMAVGNAASSDHNVQQLVQAPALLPALQALLGDAKSSTNELHLALGTLGNIAVPAIHRPALVQLGVMDRCAALVQSSNNAHVLFAAVQLARRLGANDAEALRPHLDAFLAQRDRLTQPVRGSDIHLTIDWAPPGASADLAGDLSRHVRRCHARVPGAARAALRAGPAERRVRAAAARGLQGRGTHARAARPRHCGAALQARAIRCALCGPRLLTHPRTRNTGETRLHAATALRSALNRAEQAEQWKQLIELVEDMAKDEKLAAPAAELLRSLQ